MTDTETRTSTERELSDAQQLALDLEAIAADMRHNLEQFQAYVADFRKSADDPAEAYKIKQAFVVQRAVEQVEGMMHVHTGSSDHMHYRQFRNHALQFLAGESIGW